MQKKKSRTVCENCGGTEEFYKDSAGFFICVDCGQQQADVREEYRDECDVAFECTGSHSFAEGIIGTTTVRNKSISAVTQGETRRRRRTGSSEDDDYNQDIEEGRFDPEWKKKAPSENDFIRVLQTVLMYCTRTLIDKLGFTDVLDSECRKIWLLIIKFFVESDYPAQTYFADVKFRRHKIGIRRMYTPVVQLPDAFVILEDSTIPLPVRAVVRHLGLDRLSYVQSIAPFYNGSGTRRRARSPEIVKLRNERIDTQPRVNYNFPEHDSIICDISENYTDNVSVSIPLESTTSVEYNESTVSPFPAESKRIDAKQFNKKVKVLVPDASSWESDTDSDSGFQVSEQSVHNIEMSSEEISSNHNSPNPNLQGVLQRTQTSITTNDDSEGSHTGNNRTPLRIENKHNEVLLTTHQHTVYKLQTSDNTSIPNPFFHLSKSNALRPKRTIKERHRDACISAGIAPPKNNLSKSRTCLPQYRLPRHMRANTKNRYFKYEHDEREPTALGFPQQTLTIMARERILSYGAKCNPYYRATCRPKGIMHTTSMITSTIVPDARWQADQIYEHDFLVRLIETREKLATVPKSISMKAPINDLQRHLNQEMKDKQSDELDSNLILPLESSDIKIIQDAGNNDKNISIECVEDCTSSIERERLEKQLKYKMSPTKIRELIQTDPDIHQAFELWKSRGLVLVGTQTYSKDHDITKSDTIDILSNMQTSTNLHRKFFQLKTMRHEVSATALIERILRRWAGSEMSQSSALKVSTNKKINLHSKPDYNKQINIDSVQHLCKGNSRKSKLYRSSIPSVTMSPELASNQEEFTNGVSSSNVTDTDVCSLNTPSSNTIHTCAIVPIQEQLASIDNACDTLKTVPKIVPPLISSYLNIVRRTAPMSFTSHHNSIVDRLDQVPYSQDIYENSNHESNHLLSQYKNDDIKVPLKRLDPFYHQDDWSFSTVTTPVQQLIEWRRLSGYSTLQPHSEDCYKIFDYLATNPTVSMAGTRLLQDSEIFNELKNLYLATNNIPQIKFLPILQYFFKTASKSHRQLLRSLTIKEVFELIAPPYILKTRLFNEIDWEPPRIDFTLILTILWIGLINTRHAVLSIDICRWVESGTIPLSSALSTIPLWLFEAGGLCDKHMKSSAGPHMKHDMICRDRSIIQLSESLRPYDLERTLISLKLHGAPIAAFSSRGLLPRILQHCKLPTYIQPLTLSLLDIIESPTTPYQDGLADIERVTDPLSDEIYGYIGPYSGPRTVAAAILITCRLLWPIFVYQPIGKGGKLNATHHDKQRIGHQPDIYYKDVSSDEGGHVDSHKEIIYYSVSDSCWIVNTSCQNVKEFSSENIGFIDSGIKALEWLQHVSYDQFNLLLQQDYKTTSLTQFKHSCWDINTTHDDATHPLELVILFKEFFNRGHRDFTFQLKKKEHIDKRQDGMIPMEDPPISKLISWLPTNQEMFYNLITNANKPGWIDSLQPWLFLNDSWYQSTHMEKQSMIRQLSSWIYRPTLAKGCWKDDAMALLSENISLQQKIIPSNIQLQVDTFINTGIKQSNNALRRHVTSNNTKNSIDMMTTTEGCHSLDDLFTILYKVYLKSILNTFQEPPMPTKCYHPTDVVFRSTAVDSLFEEMRFPIPYSILLRRIASFIHDNHLLLHSAASKIETWLFVSEVPERFKQQERQ